MAIQTQKISAERLTDRLSVENPMTNWGSWQASLMPCSRGFKQHSINYVRFTADASHELRTPLTAIRSVGEVALQEQKSPAEYRDVIGSMLEEVDRLTRLVEAAHLVTRGRRSCSVTTYGYFSSCSHKRASSMVEVLAEEKGQRIDIDGDAVLSSA